MATAKSMSKASANALEPENHREAHAQPTPSDPTPHPPNLTQSNCAAAASNPSSHPKPSAIDVPKSDSTKMVGAKGSQGSSGVGLVSPTGSGSGLDIEKKVRRAVPVQLSEKEKRTSRVKRLGTASRDSDASEENKRKARAERFGLPMYSADEEETKKKARLARFAAITKVDSLEQQK